MSSLRITDKKNPGKQLSTVCPVLFYSFLTVGLLLTGFSTLNAENNSDTDRAYTFFIGLDVSIPFDETSDTAHRVIGLKDNAAEIRVNNQSYFTPIDEIGNIRMKRSPKISNFELKIEDKEEKRDYTPANDPRLKWMQNQTSFSDLGDDVRPSNLGEVIVASNQASGSTSFGGASSPSPGSMAQAGVMQAEAARRQESMNKNQAGASAGGADLSSAAYYMRKMQEELAEELFDALSLSFKVSCEQYLKNPYMVMVVNASAPEEGTKTNSYIYFKSLDDITPESRKVNIRQGGFPPGFTYDEILIGIYVDGEEIASSFSQKKVKMTQNEALDFLRFQYSIENEKNSLPPMPIWKKLPDHLAVQLGDENLNKVAYIHFSETGDLMWAAWDSEGNDRVDMVYLLTLNEFPFYPAYVQGKATETTTKIRLADFIF